MSENNEHLMMSVTLGGGWLIVDLLGAFYLGMMGPEHLRHISCEKLDIRISRSLFL